MTDLVIPVAERDSDMKPTVQPQQTAKSGKFRCFRSGGVVWRGVLVLNQHVGSYSEDG